MPALVPDVNVHPEENDAYRSGATWVGQDDVVISGFSGRLPESDSIEEFKKNLYDGVDMITDDERRWPSGMYTVCNRSTVHDSCYLTEMFYCLISKVCSVCQQELEN